MSDKVNTIKIASLRPEDVNAVAQIHAAELTYSFNSKLGLNHLVFLYGAMIKLPHTFVGVAYDGYVPVGVISGTLNEQTLKSDIIKALNWWEFIARIILNPVSLISLFSEIRYSNNEKILDSELPACLSTIAVLSSFQRKGLAQLLVNSLEEYFRDHGISHYKLDTSIDNTSARSFYRKMNFTEIARSKKTVTFVKKIV